MDIALIAIVFFILLALVFLLIFLFTSINKKPFKAIDGTIFDNKSDLEVYESLYKKTKSLFSLGEDLGSSDLILGFEKSFLSKLISDGFSDLKTLVKYRKQIKSLSELMNSLD